MEEKAMKLEILEAFVAFHDSKIIFYRNIGHIWDFKKDYRKTVLICPY